MDELHGPPFEAKPAAQVYRDLEDARKRIAELEAELAASRAQVEVAAQLELARKALENAYNAMAASEGFDIDQWTEAVDGAAKALGQLTPTAAQDERHAIAEIPENGMEISRVLTENSLLREKVAALDEHDRAVRTDHEYFDHPFYSGPGCSICGLSVLHHQSEELDEYDLADAQETAKRILDLLESEGPMRSETRAQWIRREFGLEGK